MAFLKLCHDRLDFGEEDSQCLLALYIEEAFRKIPDVLFQVRRAPDHAVTVYWAIDYPEKDFIQLLLERLPSGIQFQEALDGGYIDKLAGEVLTVHSHRLSSEEITVVEHALCANLDPDVHITRGLDGWDYWLTRYQNGRADVRNCWLVIPKEWQEPLFPLFCMLVRTANLKACWYSPAGMVRKPE